MMVEVTNKLNSSLIKQIQMLAIEKEMTEQELITEFIINGINQLQQDSYEVPQMLQIDETKKPLKDVSEIRKLLGHDKTESRISFNDYVGIISSPEPTDSLKEKRETYNRG